MSSSTHSEHLRRRSAGSRRPARTCRLNGRGKPRAAASGIARVLCTTLCCEGNLALGRGLGSQFLPCQPTGWCRLSTDHAALGSLTKPPCTRNLPKALGTYPRVEPFYQCTLSAFISTRAHVDQPSARSLANLGPIRIEAGRPAGSQRSPLRHNVLWLTNDVKRSLLPSTLADMLLSGGG